RLDQLRAELDEDLVPPRLALALRRLDRRPPGREEGTSRAPIGFAPGRLAARLRSRCIPRGYTSPVPPASYTTTGRCGTGRRATYRRKALRFTPEIPGSVRTLEPGQDFRTRPWVGDRGLRHADSGGTRRDLDG